MARVVALVPDLLFGSQVVAMLQAGGHEVSVCSQEDEVWAAIEGAALLVADLNAEDVDAVTLVDSLASAGHLHGVRTLGFYQHTDVDTRRRAEEVGIDLVVPRSRMAREGRALIEGLIETTA
jgi:DNA-binding response OmpR family regulator